MRIITKYTATLAVLAGIFIAQSSSALEKHCDTERKIDAFTRFLETKPKTKQLKHYLRKNKIHKYQNGSQFIATIAQSDCSSLAYQHDEQHLFDIKFKDNAVDNFTITSKILKGGP